jgi:hypothetical protein
MNAGRDSRGATVNHAPPWSSVTVGCSASWRIDSAVAASSSMCESPYSTDDGAAPDTTRDGSSSAVGPLRTAITSARTAAAAASGAATSHHRRRPGDDDGTAGRSASSCDHTPRSTRDHAASDSGSIGGGPRR